MVVGEAIMEVEGIVAGGAATEATVAEEGGEAEGEDERMGQVGDEEI